jgi:hypothetical protein
MDAGGGIGSFSPVVLMKIRQSTEMRPHGIHFAPHAVELAKEDFVCHASEAPIEYRSFFRRDSGFMAASNIFHIAPVVHFGVSC